MRSGYSDASRDSGYSALGLADHELAERLATRAGRLLLGLRERMTGWNAQSVLLQTEGDRLAHELLVQELAAARPHDAVLSEEAPDDPVRLSADRVWIIDPLDGTSRFSEPGSVDWAVHVALVVDERPVVGAVALPALGLTLTTASPPRLPPARQGPPRVVVSRSRPLVLASVVAEALEGEVVSLGSAGAKAMAVVRGDADIYLHEGGQREWDSCAPVAVALAAGCAASRLDGSDLRYNQPDTYLPDLIICRPELVAAVLAALSDTPYRPSIDDTR